MNLNDKKRNFLQVLKTEHGKETIDRAELKAILAKHAELKWPSWLTADKDLRAGRGEFTDELQALCFAAGANSIFYGDVLLTTDNPERAADMALLGRLGLKPSTPAK